MPRIDAITTLFVALAGFTAYYLYVVAKGVRRRAQTESVRPTGKLMATGFVTAFFDTLGIGSFATTTSVFRFGRLVADELIPGTLNISLALSAIIQTYLFTRLVPVEARTLILMIVAAVLGAWIGAPIVARWPRVRIQVGMGAALLIFAAILLGSMFKVLPAGGNALALTGGKLVIGLAANFMLGALMTLGIGLYAPCMILVSLLGLTPAAAIQIMMGSCAFLIPVASGRFVKADRYHVRAVVSIALASIPAVILAFLWFRTLPIRAVQWLVLVVVVYAAIGLLLAALRERSVQPSVLPQSV
jgi:uncharacterized membrane protein YfcA